MGAPAIASTKGSYTENRISFPVWFKIGIVTVLVGALYLDMIIDLASEWWTQSESSYGMLVPPIAFYIAYLRRKSTLSIPSREDARGLWLILAACVIFLGGKLAAEFFLVRISIVFMLAGLAWTFWGLDRLRTLIFPFILLGTMVPLPSIVYNVVAAPLQLFASDVATKLAQALGVSVFRDGNIIHLATVSLGVAEACSGLHSLSALLVGSLLLGFVQEGAVLQRVVLFLFSVPLAIAVNVVRVTGTAVLADHKPEFALGFYHAFSGWLVFTLGFAALWLTGKLLAKRLR